MIEKCKRCGHIKTGIAHKVFTSCAKYKHKTYNPTGLLNNYLLKMPRVIENEDDYERYLDDINYLPRLNNDYINNIYKVIKDRKKEESIQRYIHIDLDALYSLQSELSAYLLLLGINNEEDYDNDYLMGEE